MITLCIILLLITIYGNYLGFYKHRDLNVRGFLPFEQLAEHLGWGKTLIMVTAIIVDIMVVLFTLILIILTIIKYLP
jgi:hypothetical protein